jgi:myosin heavy subunit
MSSLDRYQNEQIKYIANSLPRNQRDALTNIIKSMDNTIKSRQREYDNLNKEFKSYQRECDNLNKECSNLYNEYKKLEKKVSELMSNQKKLDEISKERDFYKQQLNGTESEPGCIKLLAKKCNNLENFNSIDNIEGMNNIEGLTSNELRDVIKENKLLESQIQKNQNNYSADDTQVFYKQQQFYRQKNFNYFLIILFYCFVFILAIYLFFFKNNMSVYFKIFITILLAIYPFIIERIEFFLYFVLYYVYALVNGLPVDLGNYYGFTFK